MGCGREWVGTRRCTGFVLFRHADGVFDTLIREIAGPVESHVAASGFSVAQPGYGEWAVQPLGEELFVLVSPPGSPPSNWKAPTPAMRWIAGENALKL